MEDWSELDQGEQQAVNAAIKHMKENPAAKPGAGKYPLSLAGIQDYVNDHGAELAVKLEASMTDKAIGQRYGQKVLRYLEKQLKGR